MWRTVSNATLGVYNYFYPLSEEQTTTIKQRTSLWSKKMQIIGEYAPEIVGVRDLQLVQKCQQCNNIYKKIVEIYDKTSKSQDDFKVFLQLDGAMENTVKDYDARFTEVTFTNFFGLWKVEFQKLKTLTSSHDLSYREIRSNPLEINSDNCSDILKQHGDDCLKKLQEMKGVLENLAGQLEMSERMKSFANCTHLKCSNWKNDFNRLQGEFIDSHTKYREHKLSLSRKMSGFKEKASMAAIFLQTAQQKISEQKMRKQELEHNLKEALVKLPKEKAACFSKVPTEFKLLTTLYDPVDQAYSELDVCQRKVSLKLQSFEPRFGLIDTGGDELTQLVNDYTTQQGVMDTRLNTLSQQAHKVHEEILQALHHASLVESSKETTDRWSSYFQLAMGALGTIGAGLALKYAYDKNKIEKEQIALNKKKDEREQKYFDSQFKPAG